jgi:hypothetical protein
MAVSFNYLSHSFEAEEIALYWSSAWCIAASSCLPIKEATSACEPTQPQLPNYNHTIERKMAASTFETQGVRVAIEGCVSLPSPQQHQTCINNCRVMVR